MEQLPGSSITRRQFDVLRLLALGYSNRKIASTLFITEHTVKAHIGVMFRILEVANRTECVRVAEDRGLLAGRL
ncbi:MAG: LuxR C-terminal-related transcriptional regulator [Sedimenticolaceae bacterium]